MTQTADEPACPRNRRTRGGEAGVVFSKSAAFQRFAESCSATCLSLAYPSVGSRCGSAHSMSTIICPSGSRMAAAFPRSSKITTPGDTNVTPSASSRPTSPSRSSTL